ncbi:hypothetical protein H2200_006029 [Cladophialophora chaetospira]|uniref:Uncharacterized protein n=1 Tax=Cladophialophora chaetospira TaxID=386627 RepID=A0AA38XAB4_9EURO|nr:hypothetical protein H2200_006029 [Cladophialophora chaetospira]
MAKNKDDPDLSPTSTALAGSDSKQKEVPPPLSSIAEAANNTSTEKPAMHLWPDNPKLKKATADKETQPQQQEELSPSSSDANSPDTLSTEPQPKTQPQSDDEDLSGYGPSQWETTPPLAPAPAPVEDKEECWAMITDTGTTHPDLDLTDRNTVTRILALIQNGWVLSHGRGPRNHENCLWCRGPIESDVHMLTHVGTDNGSKCRNSWPATCLLDWISQELDAVHGYRLKCPMCSTHFYDGSARAAQDFQANQGTSDPVSVLNTAWLRCQLFSPAFARDAAIKEGKQLIFMKGAEARKLVFLGKEKVIFYRTEGIVDPVEARNKRKWLRKHYGNNLPFTVEQLIGMGIAQSEATAIIQASAPDSTISLPDLPTDRPLELQPQFDTTWVIIDRGNNQFIMSAFPTQQAHNVIWLPCEVGKCNIKNMTAEEFNTMAKENGGLLAAVKSYDPCKDEDFKRHRVLAEGWLEHLLSKNKPDGVPTLKYELWKRIKEAHDVKLEFTLARDESADDDDLVDG